MEKLIEYIRKKYDPVTIIVYGSFADGTNKQKSDFDALVITKADRQVHDVSFVGDTQLDVFVYPSSYFEQVFDYEEFVPIYDGVIVLDTDDYGLALKNQIAAYVDGLPCKTKDEIHSELAWCRKMYERAVCGDVEGMYRWHLLLVESLEIFFDIKGKYYRGPKKSLQWMEKEEPEAYQYYADVLKEQNPDKLQAWISYLDSYLRGSLISDGE